MFGSDLERNLGMVVGLQNTYFCTNSDECDIDINAKLTQVCCGYFSCLHVLLLEGSHVYMDKFIFPCWLGNK